jgi:hypothetical protein
LQEENFSMRPFSMLRAASVATILGAAALATTANAAPVNINLVGGAPTAGPGNLFTFTYNFDLAETERIEDGQQFTIFDFAGFTGPSTVIETAPGTLSVVYGAGSAPMGLPLTTPDDPGINNLIFTYNGAAATEDFTFSVQSTFGQTRNDSFVALTTDEGQTGGNIFSSGGVRVAQAGVIPEPGTMALLATGVLPLAGAVIRRRRSK